MVYYHFTVFALSILYFAPELVLPSFSWEGRVKTVYEIRHQRRVFPHNTPSRSGTDWFGVSYTALRVKMEAVCVTCRKLQSLALRQGEAILKYTMFHT